MKSDKMTYIIYADIEYLIKKIDGCASNPEKSLTKKIGQHIPCAYSILKIVNNVNNHIENNHTLYREKDCMKKLCSSLRDHATNILNFGKKKMLPLTKGELKSHRNSSNCYIWGKIILIKLTKNKNYWRYRDHFHHTGKYRGVSHSIFNLKFNVPNEIPVVFHNASKYDYHFIIKKLANKFEAKFEFLGESTEK